MEDIVNLFIVITVCFALPVGIVYLISKTITSRNDKRTQVLMKALESDKVVDTGKLVEALSQRRSAEELQNRRLLRGSILTLIGIGLLTVGIVSGNFIATKGFTTIAMATVACMAAGISYLVVYCINYRKK